MVNCINLIIEMSPRFILGRENVPCVAEVVNRSLKADCTDFTVFYFLGGFGQQLLIRSCHEDVILTKKSHDCAGTAFVQEDSAGGSKLIEQTL